VKIDNSLNPLPGGVKGTASRADTTKSSGNTQKASAAPQDNVQLSSLATAAGNTSPIDSSRVEAIKLAISEGRFRINPEAIADGLIKSAKELVAE
jgi:negative regulator of flagellin synthesis FlgM